MGLPPLQDGPYESKDTCLDALKKEEEKSGFLNFIAQLTGNPNFKWGKFQPCFIYHETMDWLEYLEEDCCTVTEYQKGSNIALLRKWDGEKYCGIVGIKIVGFSDVAPPEVVEAFKADNERRLREFREYRSPPVCAQCGKFPADPPSLLCPGCEAYQEHTR